MTDISAIICTKGRPDLIGQAVGSVLANEHKSFELLVIDQSADDSTERALDGWHGDERLRYIHLDRVGLSAAYNTGITLSAAPLLAFTDDDCIAPANWLAAIEGAFMRHTDAELLYGQTLIAPELRADAGVVPDLTIRREEKLGKEHGFRIYGMGANFAMRRTLIERIGGFDEALGGGGPLRSSQDFDFQYRAYRSGAVCLLSPDVRVDHYGVRRGQEWTDTMTAYGVGDGAFYMKHVRCGDLTALRLLIVRVGRLLGRELLNPIRRKPTQWPYLRSYVEGMRRSLRYDIDRDKRLYRLAEG
jgi:glycosyltransferase involved in cell wall biosynthesis